MNNSNQSIRERWSLGDYRSIGRVITPVSDKLVRLVNVKPMDSVLDVACGFGNTAITARRLGAKVTGIDITPELSTSKRGGVYCRSQWDRLERR
ncbi:class I SAM-dependent methyltransferase [Candidatus Nitrosocosmicus sp. T]